MWTNRNDHAPKNVLMSKKGSFWGRKLKVDHSFVISCLRLLFPPNFFFIQLLLYLYFSTMGPCLFLPEHLFCLSHPKTHWPMSMDNVGLQICFSGTWNSMITLTFFPWCEPKWCRDKVNNQSQILHGLGTTSWSMV
jgi:hypothetical protein